MSPQRKDGITREELRDALAPLERTLEKLQDGAQAAILSANILHGNPELGLKGVLPDMQERMAAAEEREAGRDALWERRHAEHTHRLRSLEKGHKRIRRFFAACVRVLTTRQDEEEKSKVSGWKLATLLGAFGTGWHWMRMWVPVAGRRVAAACHALTR